MDGVLSFLTFRDQSVISMRRFAKRSGVEAIRGKRGFPNVTFSACVRFSALGSGPGRSVSFKAKACNVEIQSPLHFYHWSVIVETRTGIAVIFRFICAAGRSAQRQI